MPVVEPGHVVDDGDGARFDPAMVAVHGLMAADLGVLEPVGLLLGHEQANVLSQAALIAFQRQNVIRFLVDDRPGDPRVKPEDKPRAGSPWRRW